MNPLQRTASVITMALRDVDGMEDPRHVDIVLTDVENEIRKIRERREYGARVVPIGNARALARHPVSEIETIATLDNVAIETRRAALTEIHVAVHHALDDDETDSD